MIGLLASTLSGIEVAGADGVPLGVNLLPPAQRRTRSDPFRFWNLALVMVAPFALAAAMWQVLETAPRRDRRPAADHRQERRRRARQASTQRQQLVDLIEGQASRPVRTRAARPSTVVCFPSAVYIYLLLS